MLLPVRTLGRGRDLINENGVYMLRFVQGIIQFSRLPPWYRHVNQLPTPSESVLFLAPQCFSCADDRGFGAVELFQGNLSVLTGTSPYT
jgi:hypothetical protein